jgi:hypothetical protein
MARGPRKLAVTFGAASLTHYGGVYLLHRFLSRIGFKQAVATQVRVAQRNHRYTVGEMLLSLLYPMILGLERIETTQLLRQNGVFQYLTGLPVTPRPRRSGASCCGWRRRPSPNCVPCTIAFSAG